MHQRLVGRVERIVGQLMRTIGGGDKGDFCAAQYLARTRGLGFGKLLGQFGEGINRINFGNAQAVQRHHGRHDGHGAFQVRRGELLAHVRRNEIVALKNLIKGAAHITQQGVEFLRAHFVEIRQLAGVFQTEKHVLAVIRIQRPSVDEIWPAERIQQRAIAHVLEFDFLIAPFFD